MDPQRRSVYSADRCWVYSRRHGWQPLPGTHPKPPVPDVPIRVVYLNLWG